MKTILKRIGRKLGILPAAQGSSTAYEVIDRGAADDVGLDGWWDQSVAERQDAAYKGLLDEMYAGRLRVDFTVAADAVRATGLASPSLLEVGCGSGYYNEVFAHLLAAPVQYTGLDYSGAMIEVARRRYPAIPFVVGSATDLPFPDGAFDIVMNGVALMHIPDYVKAIAESRRVARRWCIYHTVPVHQNRPTTFLRKNAYGRPTVEISFNESELRQRFAEGGLEVRKVFESVSYDLVAVLGEPTVTKTFVCEVLA